jgi:hypothetical protein
MTSFPFRAGLCGLLLPVLLLLVHLHQMSAQQPPAIFVGLGDSIGEGVQSLDSSSLTQPNTYLNLVARQMGVSFPQPLIAGGPFTSIESVSGRSRIDLSVSPLDLAVSGADSTSILNALAGVPIDDETDLVEQPRTGSQIQIAEQLRAPFMICWIGNNDVLGAVIAFDHLDASQLTPVPVFTANFQQIVSRLTAWRAKVVFGTIPDVAQIGFLFGPDDLKRWLGSDFGLPQGSYTSLVAMLLIKLGINNGSILQNPDWVLDPTEVQTIRTRLNTFNQLIKQTASSAGMPVTDIHGLFQYLAQHPLTIGGVTITTRFNGGLFSLDGVHPSNFGHALAADAFIRTANSAFQMNIPPIPASTMLQIFQNDPFVDFNGDLRVHGRPFAGLEETLGPFLGISGDLHDSPVAAKAVPQPGVDRTLGPRFMQAYFLATGKDPNTPWTEQDAIQALRHVFGFPKAR